MPGGESAAYFDESDISDIMHAWVMCVRCRALCNTHSHSLRNAVAAGLRPLFLFGLRLFLLGPENLPSIEVLLARRAKAHRADLTGQAEKPAPVTRSSGRRSVIYHAVAGAHRANSARHRPAARARRTDHTWGTDLSTAIIFGHGRLRRQAGWLQSRPAGTRAGHLSPA